MRYRFNSLFIPLIFCLLILSTIFTACEKDITVDLPDAEEQIVVEGYITPGAPPIVFISRTAPFFAPVDSLTLLQYTIKDAVVTVSDGSQTDTLVAPFASAGYLYTTTTMTGEVGKTYSLQIKLPDGRQLSSVTTIPVPVELDSVWFRLIPENDSLGWAWARISDPPQAGNCFRWFAKRLGKDNDYLAPLGSVSDDRFYNGLSFDFAATRGSVPNSTAPDDNNEEAGLFKSGDTIAVRFCSITQESFRFWRSAESQVTSNGNPFGAPASLKSNITGGIGIWEGYSFVLDTIYAQ
ncbi:MAG: DUF4249 domain-containing protein [Bacteroidota bacterium]